MFSKLCAKDFFIQTKMVKKLTRKMAKKKMLFQCYENLSLFRDVNSTKFFSKLFLKNNFIRILGKCFANFNSTRTNVETFLCSND